MLGSTVTLSCSATSNPSLLWDKESSGVIPVTTNVTFLNGISTSYLEFKELQVTVPAEEMLLESYHFFTSFFIYGYNEFVLL